MRHVTKETLGRIVAELAAVPWEAEDLKELVAPAMGIITGFHAFLEEVDALARLDLGADGLPGSGARRW